jgi:hypothetical protein
VIGAAFSMSAIPRQRPNSAAQRIAAMCQQRKNDHFAQLSEERPGVRFARVLADEIAEGLLGVKLGQASFVVISRCSLSTRLVGLQHASGRFDVEPGKFSSHTLEIL